MSSQQLDNDPSKTANCECINMYINEVHKYIRKIKFAVPLHTNLYIDYSLQTFLEMSKCNGFARFLRYSVPPPLSAQRLSNVSSTRMLSLYIFQAIILPPSFVYSKRVVGKKRRLKRCSTILTAQHTLYTEEEKRRLCKTRRRQRGEVDEASAVLFELVSSDSRGERISCPRSKALSITRWLIQEGKSDSSMRLRSPVVVTRSGSVAVAPSYASSDVISRAYLRFLWKNRWQGKGARLWKTMNINSWTIRDAALTSSGYWLLMHDITYLRFASLLCKLSKHIKFSC